MINKTFIIGITGNIATGKSVIRRMLANAGVMTIDADVLANRMIYPGGPAYQAVIAAFGPEIKT
jgi:dephospho-CoA kinase